MLNEDDFDRRMQFCEDFNTFDYRDVIWTDEAKFNLNGQLNRHNCVYYSEENPHKIFEKSVNSPGVMVWAGICSRAIIGPFFFQGTVTGDSYLNMLETFALPRVVQLTDGAGDQPSLWWQQDGAPPHYSRAVRAWLDNNFPNKWIGRRGPVEWPARSPDLSPMDYSVWGIVKELVFSERPRDLEHLRERITGAFQIFNGDLCSNICNSLPSRIQHCIQENGGLFEHKRQ